MSLLSVRCATVAHGRGQGIHVTSSPSGAAVRVSCEGLTRDAGVAPIDVVVGRNAQSCEITLSKNGFADRTVTLTRMRSGMVWLNLIPGFVIGVVADVSTVSPVDESNRKKGNAAFFEGFVVGTAAGLLIDHSTGASYKQVPTRIDATLDPRP